MNALERLRQLVKVGDPQGTITVAWLAGVLDGEPAGPATPEHNSIDLTVAELAEMFDRGESTVRTWLAAGEFPNAYRLHGREWRVPRGDIEAMQRRQSKADRSKPIAASTQDETADLSSWRKHIKKAS